MIQTELVEKTQLYKTYRVNLSQLGAPISRTFYVGKSSDILYNHHLAFTFEITDVYFQVFKYTKTLYVNYKFKEIYEDKTERTDDSLGSCFEYTEHWKQSFFNRSEFDISWAEVTRLIYAGLKSNEYKSDYSNRYIENYLKQFGEVLAKSLDKTNRAVDAMAYLSDLDMVTAVSLTPMSMSKYINYYKEQLATDKADYTAEQLSIYEKFLLQEFSHTVAAMQDRNKFDRVSDYNPEITIQSFEFFLYQMKCVQNHAKDFIESKNLIKKFDKTIVDLSNAQFAADIFNVNMDK